MLCTRCAGEVRFDPPCFWVPSSFDAHICRRVLQFPPPPSTVKGSCYCRKEISGYHGTWNATWQHAFALSVLLAFYYSASLHCRIPLQRVLPPSTSGCWGCTVDTGGRVLVQVREAVLARGPFALIMLTLGHELVHACQILVGAHVTIVCDAMTI